MTLRPRTRTSPLAPSATSRPAASTRAFAAQCGPTGRPCLGKRLVGVQAGGDRRGLGRTPDLDQRHAARMHGVDEPARHEGGTGADHAQARQVGARPARVREQRFELRRDEHGQRDALGLDRLQGLGRIELGVQRDGAACAQRRRRQDVQAADVKQRQRRQHAVVPPVMACMSTLASAFAASASRAQQHALGFAGRAGGEAQQQRRVRSHGVARCRHAWAAPASSWLRPSSRRVRDRSPRSACRAGPRPPALAAANCIGAEHRWRASCSIALARAARGASSAA